MQSFRHGWWLESSQFTARVEPRPKSAEAPMADGTPTLTMARAVSYLASPYRPLGHPVTYKFAGELEGFGIFPS